MHHSSIAISLGALCFGVVIGYVTYRTLVRKETAVIGDIAGVVGAVGGGATTVWFDQSRGDSFAYYSMGLLLGMIVYYAQFLALNGRRVAKDTLSPEPGSGVPLPKSREDDDVHAIERIG